MSDDTLRVYWQPGCSSCLQAKELLKRLAIPFESVNVLADPEAMEELGRLGARTVPVVTRGERWCLAQNLDELATFVGASLDRDRLDCPTLLERLDGLLACCEHYAQVLPPEHLLLPLPGRESRRVINLAWHVFVIAEAFLDASDGATLAYEYYERVPAPQACNTEAVLAHAKAARERVREYRASFTDTDAQRELDTYFGAQPLHAVLERSCWHIAQHARQISSLLGQFGVQDSPPPNAALIAGLPLPDAVWDDEVDMRLGQIEA